MPAFAPMKMFSQHHVHTNVQTKYQKPRKDGAMEGGAQLRYMNSAMMGECTMNQGARRPQRALVKQPGPKSSFSLSCKYPMATSKKMHSTPMVIWSAPSTPIDAWYLSE